MDSRQKKLLLKLARKVLENRYNGKEYDLPEIPEAFNDKRGVFVTLQEDGELRGCIGCIEPVKSIYDGVKENALHSAFSDPRFPPLDEEELGRVKIEISILSRPEQLKFSGSAELLKKLKPSIDGVILKKGLSSATFLPQVWEQLPDKVMFLEQLSMKAGMGKDSWKSAEILTYKAEVFGE